MITPAQPQADARTLIDELLEEQRDLTAVERFARWHDDNADFSSRMPSHRVLVPLTAPKPGEQYAFEVDLDRCSGCKSCVTACHALNGLDEGETWRSTGLLHGQGGNSFQQTITTACHHCVEPGCLDGCPVLAYDKDPLTGIVRHLDDQCIGCQYCIFMCPYEVPKYSEHRGIVRKCDMCHQRLAHGEAPACVQACPSEAIRITVVETEAVRSTYRGSSKPQQTPANFKFEGQSLAPTNGFLPCSPEPAITLPTTRYVSAKPLAPNLTTGDAHEARLQPAHAPLVWMLVLTQLGAGGFALLPFVFRAAQPMLATMALAASLIGLAGSVLHLGQPRKAWRAFLGLRRSWLSREIVGFGVFALLALVTTIAVYWRGADPALFLATTIVGILGVFCSGMTYHVTRRECWRGELSIGRFFGSMAVLGSAAAWCATRLSGSGSIVFAIMLVLATVIKLSRELAFLRLCPDDADLDYELPAGLRARSAFMMRFRLGWISRVRLACGWLGGVVLPLLTLLPLLTPATVAVAGLLFCFAGEMIERFLFFRAVVVSKMPGSVHA
jgi:formate dehydrogenase iron-sulfur subunit